MADPQKNPILLLILDGWGIAPKGSGNAISQANTPNLDYIIENFPGTKLKCSGPHVGLPEGQMGNSEVGHLNIGAGRVVYQDIMRINLAIEKNELALNPNLHDLFANIRPGGSLHLMGLVSDGGVHSLQTHLHALITIARDQGVSKLYVHCFLDGRDTSPTSGATFVAELQNHLEMTGTGKIATVAGRYYAMDRDKRWERTQLAYDALANGLGPRSDDPVRLIKESYGDGITDEFVKPHVVVDEHGNPCASIKDGDGLIFFNFRADRARQLTRALSEPEFKEFPRAVFPRVHMVTMTRYEKDFDIPVLFPPEKMKDILGEVISSRGLTQLRLAETEKYAHVTYFFNGGSETPFPGEDRILVPSPRDVATYDLKPEMSVYEVTDVLVEKININAFNLYVCNFANLDMVGHTGSIPATIKACHAVDECVGRVMKAMLEKGGYILLTADHGNADDMLGEDGKVKTSHSLNPVPLILISSDATMAQRFGKEGVLADIAPTILDIWGISKPELMTGNTLIAG